MVCEKCVGKVLICIMNILKLIKSRCAIRKYQKKTIPKSILTKIVEAGRWGPSIVTLQPWKFFVVTSKIKIQQIYQIVDRKIHKIGIIGRTVLFSTSEAIKSANCLILCYTTGDFVKVNANLGKKYVSLAKIAEISAISAAIQNMILVAESLGIGSCWLDTPLFCEKEINKLLGIKNEKLVAILTLGYPAENGKRSKRKPISETVEYL